MSGWLTFGVLFLYLVPWGAEQLVELEAVGWLPIALGLVTAVVLMAREETRRVGLGVLFGSLAAFFIYLFLFMAGIAISGFLMVG